MKRSVTKKQYNSRMCFVCGLENNFGLHASFYETDSNELVAIVTPSEQHQSYPGRMHGGLAATILDETIGRAIANGKEDQVWGVTLELTTKYRKPIPLGVELRIVGRVSRDDHRFFEGTGEILLPDGSVAVSAAGKYMKVPIDKITNAAMDDEDWFFIGNPDDPREIEIP